MGFKISWDVSNMSQQIHKMQAEICSPYNDGYTSWYIKQDLYRLKWILEDALNSCPSFSNEDEWLKNQDQKKMWDNIKNSK